ncbi:MAG: right-handed parallel beta-helix repeat-containing protein [Ruminococcus sp.]|nr:right-handed parallel beta-helix repeat-containing protein [Ruminococcus sp.]MBR2304217.1 right-handed parallel beta-helix repeat-containing protein [Ruminococcus sp.]
MKHNIFKRTLAAGLAVLCVAAYAPAELGSTGLFSGAAIVASAEGEAKTWTYNITEGGVYTCPATLNSNVVISGGTEDNPVVIKIDGGVTSTVTNNYAFTIRKGYVKIIGTNDATISCNGFIRYSNLGNSNTPTGDANITVSDIVVQSGTSALNMVQLTANYNCTTNFENVTFKNYTAQGASAAIVIEINGTHKFKNCTFENYTSNYAGAIRLTGANATMENCTFKNCKALYSRSFLPGVGAIYVDSYTDLTLDNCTIENCTGDFGAVGVASDARQLKLKGNTTITNNSSGNIYLPTGATFNVDEDFTGKAGVTTETKPTDTESVTLSTGLGETQAALANKNIISDNADYTVKYDNGNLLLVKPADVNYISGASLTVDGDISLNLYVKTAADLGNGAYMVVQGPNGDQTINLDTTTFDASNQAYKISYKLHAPQMAEEVSFSLFTNNGENVDLYESDRLTGHNTFSYSVNDYIKAVKNNGGNLGVLASAMQNYGAWARKYLIAQGKVSEEVNDIADAVDVTDVTADNVSGYTITNNVTAPKILGMSLRLESETALRVYYKGEKLDNITVSDNAKFKLATDEQSGVQYIEIYGIAAQDLDKSYTITFGENGSLTLSALSYAKITLDKYSTDESKSDLCNTVKALYKYNQAANNFFA